MRAFSVPGPGSPGSRVHEAYTIVAARCTTVPVGMRLHSDRHDDPSQPPGADAEPAAPEGATRADRHGAARRLAARAHLPVAGILTVYLGFASGGYFPDSTGVAAAALAACLILRLTLAPRPLVGWSVWTSAAAAALAGLACWILASAAWSDSADRALV